MKDRFNINKQLHLNIPDDRGGGIMPFADRRQTNPSNRAGGMNLNGGTETRPGIPNSQFGVGDLNLDPLNRDGGVGHEIETKKIKKRTDRDWMMLVAGGTLVGAIAGCGLGYWASSIDFGKIAKGINSIFKGKDGVSQSTDTKDQLTLTSTLSVLGKASTLTPTATSTIIPTGTPTPSPKPTETPTLSSTPTETPVPDISLNVWTGQAGFNTLRADNINDERSAFVEYLSKLAIHSGPVTRVDSAYTALTNKFIGESFDAVADPLKETGMELRSVEINNIIENGDVMKILDSNPHLNELMKPLSTDENKVYMGVWGWGHDRDAMTAILAAGLNYEYWNAVRPGTMDGKQVLEDVIVFGSDSEIKVTSQWQELINDKIREKDLEVSESEKGRRKNKAYVSYDASTRINPGLRLSDQIEVCEEIRAGSETRDGQTQTLITVEHIDDGKDTLTEANVKNEILLFVLVFDKKTKKWDVTALTSRGFTGDPFAFLDTARAVSGNELEPCGEGQITAEESSPTPTATFVTATGTVIYVPTTPAVTETSTPPATVTDAPTQPVQSTATPGGNNNSTPVVSTPLPTAAPIETTEPATEPAPGSTPTPVFPS